MKKGTSICYSMDKNGITKTYPATARRDPISGKSSESFNGYNTPYYHRLRKAGKLCGTSYSSTRSSSSDEPVWNGTSSVVYTRTDTGKPPYTTAISCAVEGWPIGLPVTRTIGDSMLRVPPVLPYEISPRSWPELVITPGMLAAEAYAEGSKATYDALTEIGELRETFMMTKNTAKLSELRRLVENYNMSKAGYTHAMQSTWEKAVKKQRVPRMSREAAALASKAWLTWRYGIMPLVHSYDDLKKLFGMARVTDLRASAHENDYDHDSFESADYVDSYEMHSHVWGWYRGRVDLPNSAHKLVKLVGMNPVISAWQLTSLSFLADWIIPAQNNLQIYCAVPPTNNYTLGGNSAYTSTATRVFKPFVGGEVLELVDSRGKTVIQQSYSFTASSSQGQTSHKTRSPYPVSALPFAPARLNLSLNRIMDTIALLTPEFLYQGDKYAASRKLHQGVVRRGGRIVFR